MDKINKTTCYFTKNKIKEVDYKDLTILKRYVSESGKIIPMKYSGLSTKYQRKLSAAVKYARFLALIPYCDYHSQES